MNLKQNTEMMKNQTWGTEWEMTNINCRHAIRVVAQFYGTEDTISRGGDWQHLYGCKDSKGRMWWTHEDGSIHSIGEGVCELTTPIMTYDDIEDAQAILRLLRQEGAKSSEDYGCGLHIHIGAFNTIDNSDNIQNAKSLRNLANIMKSHEDILIKAINMSRTRYGRNCYAETIDNEFIEVLNNKKPRSIEGVKELYRIYNHRANAPRYRMLNYESLDDNKTIEFRLFEFHKNMHAGEFKAYLQLCMAMANYSKIVRNCSCKKVDMSNEKYAMNSWLKNMGLIGDEFKTARKMLTKRLSGDTGYRNGRANESLDDLNIAE